MAKARVFISHDSALRWWRAHDVGHDARPRTRVTSLAGAAATQAGVTALVGLSVMGGDELGAGLAELGLGEDGEPLHVLVGRRADLRHGLRVRAHLCERPLPAGALHAVSEGVFVVSPELLFVQMADALPLHDLVELGFELCGSYALAPGTQRGFVDRDPPTSVARLRAFVGRMGGARGHRRAAQALRYVCDGAASPAETVLVMLLCLPSKLGGYELPLPRLNHEIAISAKARAHTHRRHLRCDAWWEAFSLDVEYDSTAYHTDMLQLGLDSSRQVILDAMGCQHVRVTRWQLENGSEFEGVVERIRKCMGLRSRAVSWRVRTNRWRLRAYLISPRERRGTLSLL